MVSLRGDQPRRHRQIWSYHVIFRRSPYLILCIFFFAGAPLIHAAEDEKVEHVVTEGVGRTPDEAEKDAWRAAVGQVVGAMVDTETLVKNDKLVVDQVLSYSSGYIERFNVLSRDSAGGLFRVRLEAWVKRTKLQERLTSLRVVRLDVSGKDLAAQIVTRQRQATDAGASLGNALAPFYRGEHLKIVKVTQAPIELVGDSVDLPYEVQVAIDSVLFSRMKSNLLAVLKEIGTPTITDIGVGVRTQQRNVFVDVVRSLITKRLQPAGPMPGFEQIQVIIQEDAEVLSYVVKTQVFPKERSQAILTNGGIKVRVRLMDSSDLLVASSDWVCLYEHDNGPEIVAGMFRSADGCGPRNDYAPDELYNGRSYSWTRMEITGRSGLGSVACDGTIDGTRERCGTFLIGLTNLVTHYRTDTEARSRYGASETPISINLRVPLTAERARRVVRADAELVVFPRFP
jgi:hypothetical protein